MNQNGKMCIEGTLISQNSFGCTVWYGCVFQRHIEQIEIWHFTCIIMCTEYCKPSFKSWRYYVRVQVLQISLANLYDHKFTGNSPLIRQ